MLKYAIGLLTGLMCGAILAAVTPRTATLPTFNTVTLIHHDAKGRVQQATARINDPLTFSQAVLTVDYTSDQLFCSAFGQ